MNNNDFDYNNNDFDYNNDDLNFNDGFLEPYEHKSYDQEQSINNFQMNGMQQDMNGQQSSSTYQGLVRKQAAPPSDGPKNGQDKCPACGATDISINNKTGKLRCNYCRYEFEHKMIDQQEDIGSITGQNVSVGACDIVEGAEDIITLKCTSCGAEVVIDTQNSMQARCHWCRNTLSINEQIPNGSVPDMVLPFSVTREEAQELIEKFVNKRSFFAHPTFKREFTLDNVMGVYFPYMVVDINAHATFQGVAEHLVRKYTVGSGDNKKTKYDADAYVVNREFDLFIDDLTVESSADKLDKVSKNKTNNIINSILPFDTENAVKWNANYLKGYTSEKRDVNISFLEPQVDAQTRDVARFAANDTMKFYDRGANWAVQKLDVKGQDWKAAHLPVWLYSYHQKKGNKDLLHYVCVNARTKETMGSVPVHKPKLFFVSAIIELLSGYAMVKVDLDEGGYIFLTFGFIFYIWMYGKYRNKDARHTHELETRREIKNLQSKDVFLEKRKGLNERRIKGENSHSVEGNKFK